MSNKVLTVGIIGFGKMGQIRMQCVDDHPELELKAICDQDTEKLSGYSDLFISENYEHLLAQDLDIVFVCCFNNVAPRIVVDALNSGKHVFCEKPPGTCVEDVEKVIAAEKANPNLKLKYGFNHRYHYSVMEAKQMIDSGEFGKILWMRGVYGKCGGIMFENSWRNQSHLAGGGILLDQGIHMLDLMRYFCGDFVSIKSTVKTSFWKIPHEDNAFAILETQTGQIALLHSSATHWKHHFALEICLEDGYINLEGILTSTRSYGEEKLVFAKKQFEDSASAFGKPQEQIIYFDKDDSWTLEVGDFVSAVFGDRTTSYSGSSVDAYAVMKAIEAIYGV
jgi:predicted dehydrogenase